MQVHNNDQHGDATTTSHNVNDAPTHTVCFTNDLMGWQAFLTPIYNEQLDSDNVRRWRHFPD